jgi:hypothetical protein
MTRPAVPSSEAVAAHHAESVERRRAGWRMFWMVIAAITVIVLLAPLLVYFLWQARGRSLLRAQLAQIKAAGEPITTSQMHAFHEVPQGQRDITEIWAAAIKPFESQDYTATCGALPIVGTGGDPPPFEQPLAPNDELAIRKFLELHRTKLAALYAAAKEEGEVRYPRNFEQGIAMLLPEAQQVRSAVRALDLEFVILARQENLDPAIENLETRIKVGETLRHDPLLISLLVRIAVHAINIGDINSLAANPKMTDEQLARLQHLLSGVDIHAQLQEAMLGERAWCYHAFHQPMGFALAPDPNKISNTVRETTEDVRRVKRPEDCAKALEMLTDLHEAAKQEPPQVLVEVARLDGQLKQLMAETPVNRMRYAVTLMLLPAVNNVATADARGETLRDLALAAIAARRYRLQHGELPSRPEDLVPEFLPQVPIDSFDGKPLRWKSSKTGLVIYSIGKDLVDDGGTCDPSTFEPDIAVDIQ